MEQLTADEKTYYQRQMAIASWGQEGQQRLKSSRVLVIGAGGLGSPVLQYLGASGVGTIGIVDYDFVEISNLHRQIIHAVSDVDQPKTQSACASLKASNPNIKIIEHQVPVNSGNAAGLLENYDLVADCTDNFESRDAIHTACFNAGKILVSGAAQMGDGTVTTFSAFKKGDHPCFRCLYPEALSAELAPSCSEVGVAGPVLSVIGGVQAMEVIKEIIGFGESLSGKILIYNAWKASFSKVSLARRDGCVLCNKEGA